jgi:hypothetical protein
MSNLTICMQVLKQGMNNISNTNEQKMSSSALASSSWTLKTINCRSSTLPTHFLLIPLLSLTLTLSPHLCHPLLRQNQLRTATRKLNILTWKTASKNSPFSNLPDDLTTYIISYLSPIDLVKALTLSWASFIHRADSCAQVITRIPWVEEGDYGKNYFFENGVIMR